jgi:hypothetical protein
MIATLKRASLLNYPQKRLIALAARRLLVILSGHFFTLSKLLQLTGKEWRERKKRFHAFQSKTFSMQAIG